MNELELELKPGLDDGTGLHEPCPFCFGRVTAGPLNNGALFCVPDCGAWCCPGADGTNGVWVQEMAEDDPRLLEGEC